MECVPERVLENQNATPDAEPLTKAKLFIALEEDTGWSEVGIGVVSITIELAPVEGKNLMSDYSSSSRTHGGKIGKAEGTTLSPKNSRRVARLIMVDIDDASNVLITTPITLDDVYIVQEASILVWSDPHLAREIACSFNSSAGCNKIMDEIKLYQHTERQRLANVLQDEHVVSCQWTVQPNCLESIFDAVCKNTQRFGIYVRDHDTYIKELVGLFKASRESEDAKSMEYVAQILLELLKRPYNSEGKIIGQFVDNDVIEDCIDVVQYAIGRRDKASGFVSLEERRAKFKNPCHLPQSILSRIHIIFATNYLKDLVPLSLDESDVMSPSLLNSFLLRFKYMLIEEVCRSEDLLPRAFREAIAEGTSDALYRLADFVCDTSKTIKNSMIALDAKEELYTLLVQGGLFTFANTLLNHAVKSYEGVGEGAGGTTSQEPKESSDLAAAAIAIQAICDSISHCVQILGNCRENLLSESVSNPQRSTLTLLMKSVTVVREVSTLQAVYDAILGAAVGLRSVLLPDTPLVRAQRCDVVRFWIEGSGVEKPPLFLVASSLAQLLRQWVTPTTAPPLPKQEEVRVLYHLRVLQLVAEEMEGKHGGSFTELLVLSGLIPGLKALLGRSSRWCMNLQSSGVSFVATLLNTGCVRLLHLLTGKDGLVEACMKLFLECGQRNNVLSCSLGRLFFDLCTQVHEKKRQIADPAVPKPSFTVKLPDDSGDPGKGPFPSEGALFGKPSQMRDAYLYQETALTLLKAYGGELAIKSPFIAEKLKRVLDETPEEAQQADTETSSITSTIERVATSNLSEFDALAVEFGIELPPPRSASSSPKRASGMDHPSQLMFSLHGEDSLSEFSLEDDHVSNDSIKNHSDSHGHGKENEEAEEDVVSRCVEDKEGGGRLDNESSHPSKKHYRLSKDDSGTSGKWMENEEDNFQSKRHRSEESTASSVAR